MFAVAGSLSCYAQKSKEVRQQEQSVQKNYIDSLLQTKRYIFRANRVTTALPSMPFVDVAADNYFFKVEGDKIISELPFYGRSNSAPYGSINSPLSFSSTSFTYNTKVLKRRKYENTLIEIHATPAKLDVNSFDITIEVTSSGSATMNIRGTNLSNISFSGNIEKTEN